MIRRAPASTEYLLLSPFTARFQPGLPTALERELTESLRRAYSLVRRFVRLGTGLLRADMEEG